MKYRMALLMMVATMVVTRSFPQSQIPIGQWRYHIAYNDVYSIAASSEYIYGATTYGVLMVNKEENSLSVLDKIDGLSGSGITAINFDPVSGKLLIAYEDSNLDIVSSNEISTFSRLRDLSTIITSKRINHISIEHPLAYVSADYGVVVFDLNAGDVKETWRDLGATGENIRIFESELFGDSIALATSEGVLIGDLDDNLLDFSQWKRFDTGVVAGLVQSLEYFDGELYVGVRGQGVFRRAGSGFVSVAEVTNSDIASIESSEEFLFISTDGGVFKMDPAGSVSMLTVDAITSARTVLPEGDVVWVGDANNALIKVVEQVGVVYQPDGPETNEYFKLKAIAQNVYAMSGGLQNNINLFSDGSWSRIDLPVGNIVDVAVSNGATYFASFGEGLVKVYNGETTVFNEDNSPLTNDNGNAYVTAVVPAFDGLWLLNYGSLQPVRFLRPDETWNAFSPDVAFAQYAMEFVLDPLSHLWLRIDPERGGGVVYFDPFDNEARWLTTTVTTGGLPSQSVLSIDIDRDGYIWTGTELGASYFFSPEADAVKPIFENRFLLRDDEITAIVTDGGNRKWMGSYKGAWLFGPEGETLVHHFTTANSPLLSDSVLDIAINTSGEVFFLTPKGIVSFRSDATAGPRENETRIFPNPVTRKFNGVVGIAGLATDATVKITDVTGKLVYETMANGGTATWNVEDYNGRRAATGVYLVFSATATGKESMVGKIVVVD